MDTEKAPQFNADELLEKGRECCEKKDFSNAFSFFCRAIHIEPDERSTHEAIAQIAESGDCDFAVRLCLEHLKYARDKRLIKNKLGCLYLDKAEKFACEIPIMGEKAVCECRKYCALAMKTVEKNDDYGDFINETVDRIIKCCDKNT